MQGLYVLEKVRGRGIEESSTSVSIREGSFARARKGKMLRGVTAMHACGPSSVAPDCHKAVGARPLARYLNDDLKRASSTIRYTFLCQFFAIIKGWIDAARSNLFRGHPHVFRVLEGLETGGQPTTTL